MNNLLLVLSFLFCSSLLHAQEDAIMWTEDTELTWDNYGDPPFVDPDMPMNALTSAKPTVEMTSMQKGGNVELKFVVETVFSPRDSWAIEKNGPDFLLKQEQIRFDIAELFSRKLRKALQDYTYSNNYAEEYIRVYNRIVAERNDYQALYDFETQYGGNQKKQKAWAKEVEKSLENFSDYTDAEFIVNARITPGQTEN